MYGLRCSLQAFSPSSPGAYTYHPVHFQGVQEVVIPPSGFSNLSKSSLSIRLFLSASAHMSSQSGITAPPPPPLISMKLFPPLVTLLANCASVTNTGLGADKWSSFAEFPKDAPALAVLKKDGTLNVLFSVNGGRPRDGLSMVVMCSGDRTPALAASLGNCPAILDLRRSSIPLPLLLSLL